MNKKIISARLDDEARSQIEFLKRHLGGRSTTHILTEAIHNLYNYIKQQEAKRSPFELLEELNLIGCFEGEDSLSQNYKNVLSKALNQKYKSKKKNVKK